MGTVANCYTAHKVCALLCRGEAQKKKASPDGPAFDK